MTQSPTLRAQRMAMQARLNRLLPRGINRWYPTSQMARQAAVRLAQTIGDGVTVRHHQFARLGLRHYHLQFQDGRRLRIRFFYGNIPQPRTMPDREDYDHIYDREKQKFLRGLINDLDQPRHVRGWAKQELNRLEAIRRARASGQKGPQGQVGPGGDKKRLRVPIGYNVGHIDDIRMTPRQHDASRFRLEDGSVNKGRPKRMTRFKKLRAGKKVRPSRGKRLPLPG
jgi:hypothetical protein